MERYKEIVLKAGEGITFGVEERGSKTLIIRARKIDTADDNSANSAKLPIPTDDDKSANYANPPIPEGYRFVCGEWNYGFVIERCSDGSQLVWIPVGSLEPNGTLDDGKTFSEQFGRRNYRQNKFSESAYSSIREFFTEKLASLKKYGGFYISRYNLSRGQGKKLRSVKGVCPKYLLCKNKFNPFHTSKISKIRQMDNMIRHFEDDSGVICCLPGGEEYDTILEWFIESGSRTFAEIAEDSTGWGNYYKPENGLIRMCETGRYDNWSTNNIYDFAGNLAEVTAERFEGCSYTFRGGAYCCKGDEWPVARRYDGFWGSDFPIGFRVALFIL